MIKINLAAHKQSSVSTEQRSPKISLNSIGKTSFIIVEELKTLPWISIICSIIFIYLAQSSLEKYKEVELSRLDVVLIKHTQEGLRLQKELDKTKSYDEIKKNLEADEFAIKKKLETMNKLISDRTTPPKLLLALSKSIPEEVWLTELSIQETEVVFKGSSLGFNQISDFMKSLNESIYFKDLNLRSTQQNKLDSDSEIATFEIATQRKSE